MKIINLSKSKLEYTINKMIETFEVCNELDVERLIYSTTYKFQTPYTLGQAVGRLKYEVVFKTDTITIEKIIVRSSDATIEYNMTGNEDKKLVRNFIDRFLKKITEIENEQFKKVFASYDGTEERDGKLSDLLGETKEETKTTKTEPQKKKWYNFI